jgi:hypothetical protein
MRMVMGGRRARRMATRLTKGSGADEVVDGAARWHFFEGGGTVEAVGLASVQPEESSLASTWRSER